MSDFAKGFVDILRIGAAATGIIDKNQTASEKARNVLKGVAADALRASALFAAGPLMEGTEPRVILEVVLKAVEVVTNGSNLGDNSKTICR